MILRKKHVIIVLVLMAFQLCIACKKSEPEPQDVLKPINPTELKIFRIPVIFETDMTLDVDDVGALAVLHGLQKEGHVNLLCVCYNEVHKLAPAVIDAVNTYYNRGTIPIGIYSKSLNRPDLSDYYSAKRTDDVDNMKHDLSDNTIADAVDVYKQILRTQKNDSVVIVSVGFLNNLYDMLKDPEGVDLIKQKVKLLAVMGGLHNDDFNFVRHDLVAQTQYVIENWPRTLVTTYVGGDIITGETLTGKTPIDNPVRRSYELEWGVGPNNGRSSWDQVTTLYAIYGTKYFREQWDGGGSLKNGYIWSFSKDHRGYAAPLNNAAVEGEIERLMTLAP